MRLAAPRLESVAKIGGFLDVGRPPRLALSHSSVSAIPGNWLRMIPYWAGRQAGMDHFPICWRMNGM